MKTYIYDTNYARVFEIAKENNCKVALKGDEFEVRGKMFDVFRFKAAYNKCVQLTSGTVRQK